MSKVTELEAVAKAIENALAEAVSRSPDSLVEHSYRICGYQVRFRGVGKGLALATHKALTHLSTPADAPPALTIEIWDDELVKPIAPIPWPEAVDLYGALVVDESTRFILHQRQSAVMLLDRQRNRIIGGVRGLASQFLDERARPFHRLLSIWLNDRDIHFIHAGLVAKEGQGLLFIGKGGSGKSSSSVACFLNGFNFLSDDFVGLQALAPNTFIGHSLYATCLIDRVERFAEISSIARPGNHDVERKSVVFLDDCRTGGRLAMQTAFSAIILPRIADQKGTSYRRAKPMEAMLALAPSSVVILPNAAPQSLDKLSRLVSSIPAFWLECGKDVEHLAHSVEQLRDQLTT